jgi:DNA-binding LytR/AlgR family response regulator
VLVAEDELPARRRLLRMLEELGGVQVVAEVGTAMDTVREVQRTEPDLVLLDIEMPGAEGLEVVRACSDRPVVLVTAHPGYAVEAFALEVVDYLLKPVSLQRLAQALRRVPAPVPRLVTHTQGKTRLFDAREVARLWSLDGYTAFVADGSEQLTLESLSSLEARLAPFGFVRIHRAHLVQRSAVRSLSLGVAELLDGTAVPVSRRLMPQVKRALLPLVE